MRLPVVAAVLAVGVGLAARPAARPGPGAGGRAAPRWIRWRSRATTASRAQSIVNTAAIPLHAAIGFRDIQRAIKALYGTSQFDDVQILREVGPDSAEILVIAVKERPLLVRATVRGVDKLSESSVRDRIELPIGRPLDYGMVVRAVQRIDSLYQSEGYYLAAGEAGDHPAGQRPRPGGLHRHRGPAHRDLRGAHRGRRGPRRRARSWPR